MKNSQFLAVLICAVSFVFASCNQPNSTEVSDDNSSLTNPSSGKGSSIMVAANPAIATEGTYISGKGSSGTQYYTVDLMDANGANFTHVISSTTMPLYPTWSHNGSQISYIQGSAIKRADISVVNNIPTASNITTIFSWTATDSIGVFMQQWSSVGGEIAFPKRQNNASVPVAQRFCKVMILPSSGGTPTELYNDVGRVIYGLTWSPDGSKIAFGSNSLTASGDRKIKVISRSSGALLASYALDTTVAYGVVQTMDWSRNGMNKLVFRSNSKIGTTLGPNKIFTFDLDAQNPTPQALPISSSYLPLCASWASDNSKVVFSANNASGTGGSTNIFTLASSSTAQIMATSVIRISWKR